LIGFNKVSVNLGGYTSKPEDLSEDIALMSLVVKKDKKAYGRLIDLYMSNVFQFSYGILQERELAEDITQEVFLRLWKNPTSWQPKGRIKSWLLRVAHNLSIDEVRKRKPQSDIDGVEDYLLSNEDSPEDRTHKGMVEDIVKEAILKLPTRQKAAVMISYYSLCSNKEGAEIMGVTVEAFESLLARSREKLKYVLDNIEEKF